MRMYNGDEYKTIAILGSFSKHYNDIVATAEIFTKNGFEVLVPKLEGIQENSKGDFLLLVGDEEKTPQQLERDFLNKCLEADCVYVCDVDGYIGSTVSGELFFLASKEQEVYFLTYPQDSLLCSMMSKSSPLIYSPIELVNMMQNNNKIYRERTWHDTDKPRPTHFVLIPPKSRALDIKP